MSDLIGNSVVVFLILRLIYFSADKPKPDKQPKKRGNNRKYYFVSWTKMTKSDLAVFDKAIFLNSILITTSLFLL